MIVKTHHQDDQDALFKAASGMLTTFLNYDANIKSAASAAIPKSIVEQFRPPPGYFAQHMIIMGDTEAYGQNRNGDGWSKLACLTYHPTFVSHGHYFREHNHRSKDLAIGEIKYAAHNPEMSRTELIVWGNIKKAEDIYEAIKRGESRSNSMSARVPYDRCNVCENKARTPQYYCKHAKFQMNQWVPEAHKYAFVHNDHPTFFDASDVANPADRIAHYLEFMMPNDSDEMRKAASADLVIPGHEWARFEGVCLPMGGIIMDFEKQATLNRLVEHEKWLNTALADTQAQSPKLAFVRDVAPKFLNGELSDSEISALRSIRPGTILGELAKRASILPFRSFLAYATGRTMEDIATDPAVKYAAAGILPEVFTKLASDGCGCSEVNESMFDGSSPGVTSVDPGLRDPVAQILDSAESKFGLEDESMKHRVMSITIIKIGSAFPSANTPQRIVGLEADSIRDRAEFLAGIYGLYKIAAINSIHDFCPNAIDDRHELLIAAHNNFSGDQIALA